MNLIIFEGSDAVGKGVLLRSFRSYTRYQFVEMDRGHISRLVFAQYFKRPLYTSEKFRFNAEKEIKTFVKQNNAVIAHVYAKKDVVFERMRLRGEDPTTEPDPETIATLIDGLIDKLGLRDRCVSVDTSGDPDLEECAKKIYEKVKSVQKRRK